MLVTVSEAIDEERIIKLKVIKENINFKDNMYNSVDQGACFSMQHRFRRNVC